LIRGNGVGGVPLAARVLIEVLAWIERLIDQAEIEVLQLGRTVGRALGAGRNDNEYPKK
jgi:hypothetical protein